MWDIKQQAPKTNKTEKNKPIDTDNRMMVTRGDGAWGWAKWEKWVDGMVMEGNWTSGGEHADVEL